MNKLKNENYVNIQGWMVSELGLKGNELLIYAIIYGFSQDETNKYIGGLSYLAEWTNSTKQGVTKNLKSLLKKQLIYKEERIVNNVKYCDYCVNKEYVIKFNSIKQSLMGYETKFNEGIKQIIPINKNNNKYNNKKISSLYNQREYKDLDKYYSNII